MGLEFLIKDGTAHYTTMRDKCDVIHNIKAPKSVKLANSLKKLIQLVGTLFLPNQAIQSNQIRYTASCLAFLLKKFVLCKVLSFFILEHMYFPVRCMSIH